MLQYRKGDKYRLIRESKGIPKGTVVYLINYGILYWFSPNKEDAYWDNTCVSLELDDLKKIGNKNVIGGSLIEGVPREGGTILKEDGTSDWLSSEGGKV